LRIVSASEVDRLLDHASLADAIREAFAGSMTAPTRQHHTIPRPTIDATLILMPAWQAAGGGFVGVKIVTVFPDNAARQKPSVIGTYLLLAGASGEPLAVIDGVALTLRRTAAASALASRYLSRPDSGRLTMIGAGALAPHLIAAHAAVRPIREVTIWNRTAETARQLAATLARPGLAVTASDDREAAIAGADIVSVATLAHEPVLHGAWLRPGTHVDLVGAYTPAMREADDEAVGRATVYVDTRSGMMESGDIAGPIASGALPESAIAGDLHDLARGRAPGRRSADEITLFKSVGSAIEDLAAAVEVWRRLG
jgi:ornithine cyclodeaminase